jgi:type IV pilus assembly protein PilW
MPAIAHTASRQRGLSLVELMISLTISLMITASIGYLYLNSRQSYRQQDSVARIQENGRFALDAITQDIRNAGYWGCATRNIAANGGQPINRLANPGFYANRFNRYIEGHDWTGVTWSPVLPNNPGVPLNDIGNELNGSDILTLRGGFGRTEAVIAHASITAPTLDVLAANSRLDVNDRAIVSDCANATVFEITGVANAAPNRTLTHAAADLGRAYPRGTIIEATSRTYYLRNNPAGRPALYRITNGNAEELVENVMGMQITYGCDANNDGAIEGCDTDGVGGSDTNTYVPASSLTWGANGAAWAQVRAVRVRLLLVSPETNISGPAQTYRFRDTSGDGVPDAETCPNNRLCYVFTSTVALRNRLP